MLTLKLHVSEIVAGDGRKQFDKPGKYDWHTLLYYYK